MPPQTIFISDGVPELLQDAVFQLSAHFAQRGESYPPEQIHAALIAWMESSIEQLAEDALFHCANGDRAFAFNRREFERQIRRQQQAGNRNLVAAGRDC